MRSISAWLGLERSDTPEHAPLRELVEALDRLEPDRARYLARFAYLLGRIAYADRHVTAEETAAMERLVKEEGQLSADLAMLVVSLAKRATYCSAGPRTSRWHASSPEEVGRLDPQLIQDAMDLRLLGYGN